MGKCHLMLAQCTLEDIKLYNEEIERQQEAQHPFYAEENQIEYQRRWEQSFRNYDAEIDAILNAQPGHDTILTGDSALDDEEEYLEYDSDMDDCLIPIPNPDDMIHGMIFDDEINLNDLY